ncbi:MAG: 4Fe-4S dicluster domain-containing protein [Candidatus Omnitrophica bacterium]|nr:4Fe-4S dicluster domain-containing protein [Candidatus Omnitrophota bacterium]
MLQSHRTFKGGYKFKNYEGQARPAVIESPIPSRVIIPLKQGFGVEMKPLVKKGDAVFAGQIIARDDTAICSPMHSSVNGVVEDIRRMNYFKRESSMVIIRSTDSKREISRFTGYSSEWWKLSTDEIERLIYLSGVSSLDREGIPTHLKSSIISPEDVRHLIVHSVGSEPYNISLELLLEQKGLLHFFEGIKILKRIMPRCDVHLAINAKKTKIVEQLEKLSSDLTWLNIYPLEARYPQGYDEMLVPTILNQKFPYGYSAANIGAVALNAQAVIGVYNAVTEGLPLVERIIALCGPSFKENIHVKVRVGTPLSDIISGQLSPDHQNRVVLNSLLTGVLLNDFSLPVDRTFSQIVAIPENNNREFLSFLRGGLRRDSYSRTFLAKWLPVRTKLVDTNKYGEERPCISCGFCEEVCPVRIIPHLLSKYVKRGVIDETLMNYKIFNCIECGLCSFVCPSKIPLLQHMKEGHEKLIMQGCDRTQCILPYFNLKGIEEYRGVTKL